MHHQAAHRQATCSKSLDESISDPILLESFVDFVSAQESSILREALVMSRFSSVLRSQLIDLLSRFDCTEITTPANVKRIIISTNS